MNILLFSTLSGHWSKLVLLMVVNRLEAGVADGG